MKEYICYHNEGQFEFFADSKVLAIDHAKHHCSVMGYTYRFVEKSQSAERKTP